MNRKSIIAGAVLGVCLVGAGGYFYTQYQAKAAFDRAIVQARAKLGPNGTFIYRAAELEPFSHEGTLHDLLMKTPDGQIVTAHSLRVTTGWDGQLHSVSADKVHVTKGVFSADAGHMDIDGISYSGELDMGPHAIDSMRFDKMTVASLSATTPGGLIKTERVSFSNFGMGRRGDGIWQNIDFIPADKQSFDHMHLAQFHFAGVGAFEAVKKLLYPETPSAQAIGTQDLDMVDVAATRDGAQMWSIAQATFHNDQGVPGQYHITGQMRHFIDKSNPATVQHMAAFGYDSMPFDGDFDMSYRTAGGVLDITSFVMKGKDAGTISFAVKLEGVPAVTGNAAQALPLLLQVKLASASLSFADGGFLQRAIDARAKETGTSADAAREALASELELRASMSPPPFKDIQMAAATVVRHPGTLEIDVNPPAPVLLMQAALEARINPVALTSQLGLSAKAK
ncbi:MAG TPA: hypothetical protein VL574_06130 [Stellaceae bacterium]|jgi:hypothetical protein|nr:hypothetical protein [Stellaceae bacterium]